MAARMALRSTTGALRGMAARSGGSATTKGSSKRGFSSSAQHDDAYETAKWEKITYLGIASCTALATFILSKGHAHHDEPPAYSYLHIRNKEFPWGPDGLFESKHH